MSLLVSQPLASRPPPRPLTSPEPRWQTASLHGGGDRSGRGKDSVVCVLASCSIAVFCQSKRRKRNVISARSRGLGSPVDSVIDQYVYDSRPLGRSGARFSQSRGFNAREWAKHVSPTRYVRELTGLVGGTTTRRVLPIVTFLTVFSVAVEQYDIMQMGSSWLPDLKIPLTPFELTAPLLGLLLVFRTDRSFDRYKEGNEAVWSIGGRLKDLLRGLLSNTADETPRHPDDVRELCKLIVDYHSWICLCYLVQNVPAPTAERNMKTPRRARQLLGDINRRLGRRKDTWLAPTHVQLAISRRLNLVKNLNEQQRQGMDTLLWEVTQLIAHCERTLRNPIPLGYTRATVRFLFLWLTLLPFALIGTFEEFTGKLGDTMPLEMQVAMPCVVFFIGLTFLSLEDVACQIEEPFAVQRSQLQKVVSWFEIEAKELVEIAELGCEMDEAQSYEEKRRGKPRGKKYTWG